VPPVTPGLRKLLKKKKTEIETPIEAPSQVVVVVRHPAKKPVAQRIFGAFTFVMIPGFLLATSIPAIAAGSTAFGEDTAALLSAPKLAPVEGQSISASVLAAATEVSRSEFTAETHAQIAARQAAQARAGAYSVVKPQQAGDDYPWRASSGGLSPLGYVTRQCTDFVAWRINRDHGTTNPFVYTWSLMTPGGGSASRWASAWNRNGWQTSNTPVPGAVAWFTGNHVAYVKSVNSDGTVDLEEYNWGGDASYHTRTIAASSVALFLYPPP
jgi:surface antigen